LKELRAAASPNKEEEEEEEKKDAKKDGKKGEKKDEKKEEKTEKQVAPAAAAGSAEEGEVKEGAGRGAPANRGRGGGRGGARGGYQGNRGGSFNGGAGRGSGYAGPRFDPPPLQENFQAPSIDDLLNSITAYVHENKPRQPHQQQHKGPKGGPSSANGKPPHTKSEAPAEHAAPAPVVATSEEKKEVEVGA